MNELLIHKHLVTFPKWFEKKNIIASEDLQ